MGDVIDIGESISRAMGRRIDIPFKRLSKTTYPIPRHIPQRMMEQALAQRNRSSSLKSRQALSLTHPNAAGIDIGAAAHFVAVPPDRDEEPVRPRCPGPALGSCRIAQQPIGPRRIFPSHVRTHGQAQGRDRRRSQARAAHLRDAHQSEEYTDQGQDHYEERYRARVLHQMAKRAEKLGMKLVAIEQPA